MKIPDNAIPNPIDGAFMTYSVGGKNIFSVLNGYFPDKEETKTFPIVKHNGVLCLENNQGVKISIRVFTKSRRVTSFYFHT